MADTEELLLEEGEFDIAFHSPSDSMFKMVPIALPWPRLADKPSNLIYFQASAQIGGVAYDSVPLYRGTCGGSCNVAQLALFSNKLLTLRTTLAGSVSLDALEGWFMTRFEVINRTAGTIAVDASIGEVTQEGSLRQGAKLECTFLTDQSYLAEPIRAIGAFLAFLSSLK